MAVKSAAGAEVDECIWFVIYMMMQPYFRKEYLPLQICWHISDKGQSFTFFTCYVKTDAPTWTRDLWEKLHSHLLPPSLKTHTLDPLNCHEVCGDLWPWLRRVGKEMEGWTAPGQQWCWIWMWGCALIPVQTRHGPPAWIIYTLLNSDQCSKISAKMLFSVSDLLCFALPALEAISGWGWWNSQQPGDLDGHPQADGRSLLSGVSLLRATPASSLASTFAADLPGVIQAVYSLEGFSLSRHLAASLQPSASPALQPGTQPLQPCTRGLWSWKTPCCWDTQRRKAARFIESTALSHTPFSCLRFFFFFFSQAPCFWTGIKHI